MLEHDVVMVDDDVDDGDKQDGQPAPGVEEDVGGDAPLSQTPKNSFKRWPSPRNDLVVSNKLFQGPFIPLLWILFGQTGYPIKFFTYK